MIHACQCIVEAITALFSDSRASKLQQFSPPKHGLNIGEKGCIDTRHTDNTRCRRKHGHMCGALQELLWFTEVFSSGLCSLWSTTVRQVEPFSWRGFLWFSNVEAYLKVCAYNDGIIRRHKHRNTLLIQLRLTRFRHASGRPPSWRQGFPREEASIRPIGPSDTMRINISMAAHGNRTIQVKFLNNISM